MAVKLSAAAEQRIETLKKRYPDPKSAVMPALYIAQEELGYVSDEAILWVAEKMNMAPIHVREVATFYTMYYQRPVGRYHIQVCRTLACALCGARALTEYVVHRLGVKPGQVTANGLWSFEEVECLGSCGTGPMIEINDCFFENLTPEKLGMLMDRIEKELPDLRYSTVRDELGAGLKDWPKSEVHGLLVVK